TSTASAMPSPTPPSLSGRRSANTPIDASSAHRSRSKPPARAVSSSRSSPKRPAQKERTPSRSAPWSSVRRKSISAVPGQAEDALGDDVALDLRGAGGDRERERVQVLAREHLRGQAGQVVAREAGAAEQAHAQLAHALEQLGVEELD